MSYDPYTIKVISGSRHSVDAIIENELKEYPKKDYGTVILHLSEREAEKTVRIIRYKTKEICDGKELKLKEGTYPFGTEISL